jgi:hypothetical protein
LQVYKNILSFPAKSQITMKVIWVVVLASFIISYTSGQNLSFSTPVNFLPGATTDKAIDITRFKGNYFVTWNDGRIHVTCPFIGHDVVIPAAASDYGPVLRFTSDYIYVFWIDKDGSIKYTFNSNDTSFAGSTVYTLSSQPVTMGITATFTGGTVVITAHGKEKGTMFYAVATSLPNGILHTDGLKKLRAKSASYPFVVTLADKTVRMLFRGYKDQGIYYLDGDIETDTWSDTKQLSQAQTRLSPAIYKVFDTDKLFYIWKGAKRLYYTTDPSAAENELPVAFTTSNAVSICAVDKTKFILAYTGDDHQMYLSYFTSYNPSKWMESTFYPHKAAYSLQDIVLPGAHDAGMSVLTATGGMQGGTVNECNTLTQTQPVKAQLNAGIRMFDLRIGLYKDSFYTKHCAADCMIDAIGGGYGEKLSHILSAVREFLSVNKKETVILSFSHFCEKEAPAEKVARYITDSLGKELIFTSMGRKLKDIKLEELAGKAVIVFEQYTGGLVDSGSIAATSTCFINFKREYAATNNLAYLTTKEKIFFSSMGKIKENDLVRLDWQLTQSSDEAAMICNDFQDENISPVINGALLLTNVLRKHLSIKKLSLNGNKSISPELNGWINSGIVHKDNKPNILYVDVAGGWITDYCIQLNMTDLYTSF